MKNDVRWFLIIPLVAVAAYGFGCNPTQQIENKVSEKVAEGLIGQATGGKVDLNENGSSVTYRDNKTGDVTAYGENIKIPDDFPKDVPIYPGSKATNVSISKGADKGAVVVLSTEDSTAKVLDWYVKELKSLTETENMTINGAEYREYQKDNKKIGFSISSEKVDDKTTTGIMVTYSEETPTPSE